MKSTPKGLRNRSLRVGSLPKPILNRMCEIDVCHRSIDMKQRIGCVEKNDVDGGFHEVRISSCG